MKRRRRRHDDDDDSCAAIGDHDDHDAELEGDDVRKMSMRMTRRRTSMRATVTRRTRLNMTDKEEDGEKSPSDLNPLDPDRGGLNLPDPHGILIIPAKLIHFDANI